MRMCSHLQGQPFQQSRFPSIVGADYYVESAFKPKRTYLSIALIVFQAEFNDAHRRLSRASSVLGNSGSSHRHSCTTPHLRFLAVRETLHLAVREFPPSQFVKRPTASSVY